MMPMALSLALLATVAAGSSSHVSLTNHLADLEPDYSPPRLRVRVTVGNDMAVTLRGVRLGIMFAAEPHAFGRVMAGKLYSAAPTVVAGVGALVGEIALTVPPRGAAGGTWFVDLPPDMPTPAAFDLHLLSYTLAEPTGEVLLGLLGTAHAADEAAACAALGLTGKDIDKARARQALGPNAALQLQLIQAVQHPAAAKPSQDDVLREVYAVRALGVLGGPSAIASLQAAAAQADLSRYDEPLQIMRVAQVSGSPVDSPLAFMVPPAAYRMSEVVAAALQDANTRLEPPPPDAIPPPWERMETGPGTSVGRLLLLAALGSGLWWVARRAKKP